MSRQLNQIIVSISGEILASTTKSGIRKKARLNVKSAQIVYDNQRIDLDNKIAGLNCLTCKDDNKVGDLEGMIKRQSELFSLVRLSVALRESAIGKKRSTSSNRRGLQLASKLNKNFQAGIKALTILERAGKGCITQRRPVAGLQGGTKSRL